MIREWRKKKYISSLKGYIAQEPSIKVEITSEMKSKISQQLFWMLFFIQSSFRYLCCGENDMQKKNERWWSKWTCNNWSGGVHKCFGGVYKCAYFCLANKAIDYFKLRFIKKKKKAQHPDKDKEDNQRCFADAKILPFFLLFFCWFRRNKHFICFCVKWLFFHSPFYVSRLLFFF